MSENRSICDRKSLWQLKETCLSYGRQLDTATNLKLCALWLHKEMACCMTCNKVASSAFTFTSEQFGKALCQIVNRVV